MADIRIDWNGPACERRMKQLLMQGLSAAGRIVENRANELLSVDGSGKVRGRRRRGAVVTRSLPGEPPRAQTKQLLQSVTRDENREEISVKVGTPLEYGAHLELGTRKMRPRPWLRRSLIECKERIETVIRASVARLNGG